MKKLLSLALAMLLVLSMVACGQKDNTPSANGDTDSTPETYNLIWGGTSASSGYYALNVALCDVINTYVDGVTVTLMETGGTVDDYKLMREGEASFAQTSNVNQYCLQNDIAAYEGFGYADSYDMCFFVPQAYYFVVSKSSGITTPSELEGQKFNAGLAGSSSEIESMNILGALNIEPNWYPASTADAVEAIQNRQITGFVKSGTSLSTETTIAGVQASIDIDVLSFSDEEAAIVNEQYPYYTFKTVSGDLFGLDHDFNTYCSSFGFSVSKDVPEDVVYRIVKAFDEHLDEIRAAYPGIVDDPIALTAESGVESFIHPGVVKYMQEKGLEVDAARIPQA